jgi:hypothetical protein
MTFLFIAVNLSVIFFLSRVEWRKSAGSDTVAYWTGLSLRLIGGIALGLVYRYYYHSSGDTFVFFNDAARLADLFYSDPGGYLKFLITGTSPVQIVTTEGRSVFFVAIVSVVNLVTHNNYWLSSLWFSFFSFWCSYRLVAKLDSVFPSSRMASRVALLFLPSAIFWNSGIIKESVAFGAAAIIVIHFLTIMRGQKLALTGYLALAVNLYLLLSLKYYWGAVLIPCFLSGVIVYWRFKNNGSWTALGVWMAVFILLSFAASFAHPNFYVERFLGVIVENHDKFVDISSPENLIEYKDLKADWPSVIINSPWALLSGLFRPTIFEARSLSSTAAGIENLFLLVLVVWKLKSIRMPRRENRLIVISAIVYVVVLCAFLALSTPNLGTLSRYRVGFLSIFVLLILNDHPVWSALGSVNRTKSQWKIQ